MRNIVKHYPDELKYKVVQEYLTTSKSLKELRKEYGILGINTISNWKRKFGEVKLSPDEIKLHKEMSKEKKLTSREIELEARLKKAEQALEAEQLRSLALSTLIDIAEREFKIPIRKKPGTKQ